jgi:putative intracellular protease/amidase
MKILMVMTSHDKLGNTGRKTGVWLEEFAAPYYVFHDAGVQTTLASPRGGHPPIDPKSEAPQAQTAVTKRLYADKEAQTWLSATVRLRDAVNDEEYDAVFYPGGHGPLWDLAESPLSIELIETMNRLGRPIGAVCHGPCVFRHARGLDDAPLVKDRAVTGFTNTEEASVGLIDVVPFLVEDMLRQSEAHFGRGPNWFPHGEADGNLFTGQNPASAELTARAMLRALAIQPSTARPGRERPIPPPPR